MVTEFHNRLFDLIGNAQQVEKKLEAHPYQEPVERISKLDELRSSRLQAEELMRCTDFASKQAETDFGAIVQEIAAKLEREIEECERCIAPSSRK